MFGRRKIGAIVETFVGAGHYQHRVYNIGVDAKNLHDCQLSNEIIEMLKKVNEKVYDAMSEGSSGLVVRVEYKTPRKTKQ
jgi:hypothetical protein